MIQCKMLCRKHMFLLTTVVQKAVSRGLHVPGRAVELGGPTTSRAHMSKVLSLFLLVYLSDSAIRRESKAKQFSMKKHHNGALGK